MTITWTAHNIKLSSDRATIDINKPTVDQDPIFVKTSRLLNLLFPDEDKRKNIRLVDLACLEGGYSVEFARLGFDVTGIEIREVNLEACNFAQSALNLPNLKFVKDDVRNIRDHGQFDIVFCCGIFYHLDDPIKFLSLLGEITKKLLILNTHFATEIANAWNLGEIAKNEGHLGRWFPEFDTSKIEEREIHRWASWNNNNSFWLMKNALINSLRDSGFPIVLEEYGYLNEEDQNLVGGMPTYDRGHFIGIKNR